jgi:hypothetical protein
MKGTVLAFVRVPTIGGSNKTSHSLQSHYEVFLLMLPGGGASLLPQLALSSQFAQYIVAVRCDIMNIYIVNFVSKEV